MADIIDDTESFIIALEAEPGLGDIVSLTYPATVQHGTVFNVDASTKNVGTGSSTFVMEVYVYSALKSRSPEFTLAGGATSTDKIPPMTAPASGTSMNIEVRCIRIT